MGQWLPFWGQKSDIGKFSIYFLVALFYILEYRMPMNLLPQDVLIMIKLVVSSREGWTYNRIAHELNMSPSMAHSGVKRAIQARLFDPNRKRPRRKALEEFLIHGMKYAFPPDIGSLTRGIPTAFASPAFEGHLSYDPEEICVALRRRFPQRSPLFASLQVSPGNCHEGRKALFSFGPS